MGYSVIRLEDKHATLMEFAASSSLQSVAGALLHATIGLAREAGCHSLVFYATRRWRYWGLFHRVGFVDRSSEFYRTARCPDRADVSLEENWQLLPGDKDVG